MTNRRTWKTALAETVDIPRPIIDTLLDTIRRYDKRPGDFEVISDLVNNLPTAADGTCRITVRTAFWLQDHSRAEYVYDLDMAADETYEHPARIAELDLNGEIEKQARWAYDRRHHL